MVPHKHSDFRSSSGPRAALGLSQTLVGRAAARLGTTSRGSGQRTASGASAGACEMALCECLLSAEDTSVVTSSGSPALEQASDQEQ